ncbi:class I SAM-dependent methyltransferase [Rhodopseudomonas sp. WA056]|uniref:class I SAM-dependent methyltransferase n=1 Tax=Rhodopseudomonas sp. WA056 TaxID=2269367 RepID=UPI0013DEA395|nr:class I SAM-dependent methyltransferase [Rhodopseudomonas sp. WA056]NEW89773.1 class I SAM-dependent methyltransferase [Rhodopseudomonas sp. WA056]
MADETRCGGYDDGYLAVPCFWGSSPGSLVKKYLNSKNASGFRVLDVGAGEGKNAAAFIEAGAKVDALEISAAAITNGKAAFTCLPINWINANVLSFDLPTDHYDVVISYGLTHCLASPDEVRTVLSRTKKALKKNGSYLLVTFNDGSHDFSAHPNFEPLLLPHDWYLQQFSDWTLQYSSDTLLHETHPHNQIPHHHSLTRLVAERP